jgi:hypothetical protein
MFVLDVSPADAGKAYPNLRLLHISNLLHEQVTKVAIVFDGRVDRRFPVFRSLVVSTGKALGP